MTGEQTSNDSATTAVLDPATAPTPETPTVPAAAAAPPVPAPEPKPAMVEHRIAKRYKCDGFAEVVLPKLGFLFRGEIIDLSEFGCFIKTRARLNVRRSAEAELRFSVNNEHFAVHAVVRSLRPGIGIGFEFSVIEPTTHKTLLEMIDELGRMAAGR